MSLRERLRLLPTRSLYFAVFLAMVGTLSLSFLVFQQISVRLQRKHFDPVYDRLDELQLESATRILNRDGQKALANYLTGLDHLSGARHYLLDAHGIDLVDGGSKAELLPPYPASKWRIRNRWPFDRSATIRGWPILVCSGRARQAVRSFGRFFRTTFWCSAPQEFCVGWPRLQWCRRSAG